MPHARHVLSVHSTTARHRAAISQNLPRPFRASLRLPRFPRRVRRIPGLRARTPRPPPIPAGVEDAGFLRLHRHGFQFVLQFDHHGRSAVLRPTPGNSRQPHQVAPANRRARVLRRSSRSKFSAPASAPRRKPKAASQKNAFPARIQTRTVPSASSRTWGVDQDGSLRCAARRARRRSKAVPARGTPRRPRPRALGSVFFSASRPRSVANHRSPVLPLFLRPFNAHSTVNDRICTSYDRLRGCAEIRRPLRGPTPTSPQNYTRPFSPSLVTGAQIRPVSQEHAYNPPGGHSRAASNRRASSRLRIAVIRVGAICQEPRHSGGVSAGYGRRSGRLIARPVWLPLALTSAPFANKYSGYSEMPEPPPPAQLREIRRASSPSLGSGSYSTRSFHGAPIARAPPLSCNSSGTR